MTRVAVLNIVGLTPNLIGDATPALKSFRDKHGISTINPVLPAVTTTVQTTYLTGKLPTGHGIVGNGWYFRDESEIHFWKQSDKLVQSSRIWDAAKRLNPSFTAANICWWYAMYSGADYTVTPRPQYLADGRKMPDCWTHPPELREQLQGELGQFPLFKFWGPATDISATQWIADAAVSVDRRHRPTLSLVYLPHLDYCMQRRGPAADNTKDLGEVDAVCGKLIDYFASQNVRVIVLSEYGIAPVSKPVHLNRVLREAGLLTVRSERGLELLDAGASAAFAVADHQIAQVYLNDASKRDVVRALLEKTAGVGRVLDEAGKREVGLGHDRAGDLIVLAEPGAWFTYYYWLDDTKAPDFARTVDIHRKPGYDPVELFLDPAIKSPKAKIGMTLLKRKLGFRAMMDVIPLDASLVKGSHGIAPTTPGEGAMWMTDSPGSSSPGAFEPTDVFGRILSMLEL